MLCTFCPPTILGDFYRIPEKLPKSSADTMYRACKTKDQTLKKIRTLLGRGEKTPTPKISALLRKRAVLLRANFVLTKERKRPYYGHFCGKIHREGSCSKAARGP